MIVSLVLLKPFGTMSEGDIVQVNEDVAQSLIGGEAPIAREASDEDISGEAPAEDVGDVPAEEPVEASVRSVADEARKAVVDATEQAVKGVLAQQKPKAQRPFVGNISNAATPVDRTCGFKSIGEFAQTVARAEQGNLSAKMRLEKSDKAIRRNKGNMSEGVFADGGALVPVEYADQLFDKAWNQGSLIAKCTQYPISGNTLEIPVTNETSGTSGIRSYWTDEGDPITDSKLPVTQVELKLNTLATLVNVTEQLLSDNAYALGTFLSQHVPKKMMFELNKSVLYGTGSGANVVSNAATVKVTRATGNRISYADVVGMYARLWTDCTTNSEWFISPSNLPELYKLAFPDTSGSVPIFVSQFGAQNVTAAPAATLLGRPVNLIENMQALGATGDLLLADLSQVACIRKELDSAETMGLYFDKYIRSFRFVLRVDTASQWVSTWTRADGVTCGPFVTLSGASTSSS